MNHELKNAAYRGSLNLTAECYDLDPGDKITNLTWFAEEIQEELKKILGRSIWKAHDIDRLRGISDDKCEELNDYIQSLPKRFAEVAPEDAPTIPQINYLRALWLDDPANGEWNPDRIAGKTRKEISRMIDMAKEGAL